MLKGIIRANHPSGQHLHGDAVFTTKEQRFVVDPDAVANVLAGDEWTFTQAFYDSLRPKIGAQLAVEPVGVKGGEEAARVIADLEQQLAAANARNAELEQALAAKRK